MTRKVGGVFGFQTVDTRLAKHNGKRVTVLRSLRDDETDIADVGPMFEVRLTDQPEVLFFVYEDELGRAPRVAK